MLEWDQFRYVLAIHRGGSLQAAARALRVDRATVVRRLDALETALGARLFERRSDGCSLTRAGLEVIVAVEGMEDAATAAVARAGGEDKRPEGVVSVTVPEFFAVTVLIPALGRLRAVFPNITVEVSTGHDFRNLARGEADIALRNRRPDHNSLVSRHVGSVAIGLFASRTYAATRGGADAGFAGHDMLLFDATLAGMPGAAWVEENAGGARIVMRSNELVPIVTAVRADLGIGLLPAILAHGDPGIVAVSPGIVGRPDIFLITHRDLRTRARVRVVYDFIVRLCTENAAALSGRAIAERFGDRP